MNMMRRPVAKAGGSIGVTNLQDMDQSAMRPSLHNQGRHLHMHNDQVYCGVKSLVSVTQQQAM